MKLSFKILTFRGIDVKVHISFILILLWASYYWGSVVDDGVRGVVFGIVATLLLFACVTLHEFGHAIQAQSYGIAVKDITLLPIGGLARLESIPEDPKKELRIAVAGPAVNVAIAIVLGIVSYFVIEDLLTSPFSLIDNLQAGTWQALLSYLLVANIWLVLFNLIPAFPLDGGRILRSLLAMRLPHQRATRIAAMVGQMVALLLGLAGLTTGNYFLVLVAMFVWFGAGQEAAVSQARPEPEEKASGLQVSSAMTRSPRALLPTDRLDEVVAHSSSTNQSDFPVLDKYGYVIGMLSLDDLLRGLHETGLATVGQAMKSSFPVGRTSDDIARSLAELTSSQSRAMPVIADNGQLLGILTLDDIASAFGAQSVRTGRGRRFQIPQTPAA